VTNANDSRADASGGVTALLMHDGWASRCGRSRRLTVGRSHSRSGVIPEGFPILALHGTPGCRLVRWPREELYAELGVCFVTHDRAEYGMSDRNHGRRVVDEVADVRALADELGFDRFGVNGGSGGGPHVLACAALLPDRVVRATCDVGVAPLGTPGLEQGRLACWHGSGEREGVRLGARWRGHPYSRAASLAAAVRGTRPGRPFPPLSAVAKARHAGPRRSSTKALPPDDHRVIDRIPEPSSGLHQVPGPAQHRRARLVAELAVDRLHGGVRDVVAGVDRRDA
jgi:pimeloyl-ACP methyl ester carboxylesterase